MNDTKSWKPMHSPELRHAIETCAREVAGRLTEPERVRELSQTAQANFGRPGPVWSDLDLATGYPGLCLLFGEMDRLFPGEEWDVIGHSHLVQLQHSIQAYKLSSLSLWGGLSGIAIAVRGLSRGGSRYRGFMHTLQEVFLHHYQRNLRDAIHHLKIGVHMRDYDVFEGFTGIGRYLLAFADYPELRKALNAVLTYLVRLSENKIIDGQSVPGWHIPASNLVLPQEKIDFPYGSFNCGVAHGIPGPLALLSLSLSAGVEVPGQRQAIRRIAEWLLRWKQEDKYGPFWPQWVAWETQQSGIGVSDWRREAWCYGNLGVARTLWLAGKALDKPDWQQISLDTFVALAHRPEEDWNIHAPTLCHGWAGLLQMTQRMYADSGADQLNAVRERLAWRILESFDGSTPFGFSEVIKTEHETSVLHSPGLLQGAVGAVLALLGLYSAQEPDWDQVLLIT